MKCFVMLMIVLFCGFAQAQTPQVMIRARLEPQGNVVAGEQVKLVVDCLTTTWFTEAPDWPLFDVPGALVTLPDENAQNLDETIGGMKWFGVSRAYRITPQMARRYDIPSFAITLHPGGAQASVQARTPALGFVAAMPPGAQGMTVFFPTTQLTATQTVTPAAARVQVGDIVTRTIVQRAAATESMLIPPIVATDTSGLRRNATRSATKNLIDDHAGLVAGERTDIMTYAVERAGTYHLPAITIEWWNTKTQRRETLVLPAVSIHAIAAHERPLFSIPADTIGKGAHRVIYVDGASVAWALACVAAVFAVVWAWPVLMKKARALCHALHARIAVYRTGEWPAWRALVRAARSGANDTTIAALYRWIDRREEGKQPAQASDLPEPVASAVAEHYRPNARATTRIGVEPLRAMRRRQRAARRIGETENPPLNPAP